MRSATFTLPTAIVVMVIGVLLVRPNCGPSCRTKREQEPVSSLLAPAPPETLVLRERWRIKKDLARRITAERIPLLEAAELFREANGEDGLHYLSLSNPNHSLHELLCRQVIDYVAAAEREMEAEGRTWIGTRVSEELQRELDLRIAAGQFPRPPHRSSGNGMNANSDFERE